jgi:glycosyltransferase involved in cell wall biosynthesis
MYKKNPKISIITSVLNDERGIEKTLKSVINQKYKNLEYIVVDGGSTDKTLKIIRKYKKHITKIVSKKDNGIYYGFNRGLSLATGDIIGIINSSDVYTKKAFKLLIKYYERHRNVDFFFGAVKKHYGILHGYRPWKIYFSWGFYSSHSTGFFIKKGAAKIVGKYNTIYKISSDYDYFYRMIVKHKFKGVGTKKDELFGIFSRGGYSSKVPMINRTLEEILIRKNNGQNIVILLFIFVIKILFNFRKMNN